MSIQIWALAQSPATGNYADTKSNNVTCVEDIPHLMKAKDGHSEITRRCQSVVHFDLSYVSGNEEFGRSEGGCPKGIFHAWVRWDWGVEVSGFVSAPAHKKGKEKHI